LPPLVLDHRRIHKLRAMRASPWISPLSRRHIFFI